MNPETKSTAAPPPTPAIPDAARIAHHLSAAIQMQTASSEESIPAGPFLDLHRLLETQYPRVHRHLRRETVNELSLLYTWPGARPELPAIAFLAHQDVVPVGEGASDWTHPAFSGAIDAAHVWGRGAIDMKCQLVTLMEAVEALLAVGFQPQRTVYLAFGHDEEVGGKQGARGIAETLAARGVRLAALMDEGGGVSGGVAPGIPGLVATVAFAEKAYANIRLEATARAGHASLPSRQTAIGILSRAITRIEHRPPPATLEFARPTIRALLPRLPWYLRPLFGPLWLTGGLVKTALAQSPFGNAILRDTVAPTMAQAGYKVNVLPGTASASLNCRLLPGRPVEHLLAHLRRVIADPRVSVTCMDTSAPASPAVSLATPYYRDLETAIGQFYPGAPVCPILMFGSSDARHYETLGGYIYRFQPICFAGPEDDRTHGTDERVEILQLPVMTAFNAMLIQRWSGQVETPQAIAGVNPLR